MYVAHFIARGLRHSVWLSPEMQAADTPMLDPARAVSSEFVTRILKPENSTASVTLVCPESNASLGESRIVVVMVDDGLGVPQSYVGY